MRLDGPTRVSALTAQAYGSDVRSGGRHLALLVAETSTDAVRYEGRYMATRGEIRECPVVWEDARCWPRVVRGGYETGETGGQISYSHHPACLKPDGRRIDVHSGEWGLITQRVDIEVVAEGGDGFRFAFRTARTARSGARRGRLPGTQDSV